jgi:PAS domain S-box-containing protein
MTQSSILSDRNYKEILNTITDGFAIVDIDSKIIEINPAYCEMYGYERDELIGFPITRLIDPDFRHVFDEFLDQIIETGRFVGESVDIRKDGSTIHVEARGRLINISDKVYLLAIIRDMTEHKRMASALQESEARYTDLYENAPDMYASVDSETTRIIGCNRTLADNLGFRKKEIIGRPVFEIYHPDCLEAAKQTFRAFMKTGEVHNREFQLLRKDGSRIAVSLNVSAVRDEEGNIRYSRSALRDITDRKRAEKVLQQERNKLRQALEQIAELGGTAPICASCKKRMDNNGKTGPV